MPLTDLATTFASWLVFGVVAFFGAFAAYCAIRSKSVQTVGAFVLALLGGFALTVLIAVTMAGVRP